MAIIHRHHIRYAGSVEYEDWTVEIKASWHKVLTAIQRTKPTVEEYVLLTNFIHAVTEEWQRYRYILDIRENE